ncbi:hypothetical protein CTAYLR_007433 [Chrysophaeum taylorii]|uniref:Bidirectional sugar transporter SWEET n=1 Tax=Chrysophaeum taylorii TaxID=2483200 RepID=A0AAD7U9U4_9STRA|nr:hypothetical protein CTAYLR_007433 [Chrysophaeum taylorii]
MVWGSQDPSSTVVFVIGWFGAVGAWALFLSPINTFRRVIRERHTQGFDHVPYVVTTTQCFMWVMYSVITPGRLMPLVTNAVGAGIELGYCGVFLRFSPSRVEVLRDLGYAAACIAAAALLAHLTPFPRLAGGSPATSCVGVFASISAAAMYASPLNVAKRVVETKSVEFMPLALSVGSLICSSCWAAFGFSVGDFFIFVPNFGGVLLALTQLVLYAIYRRSPTKNVPKFAGKSLPIAYQAP